MDHLAEIKKREREVVEAIRRGEPWVDNPAGFMPGQLELSAVLCDRDGRLWTSDGKRLWKVFDPAWMNDRQLATECGK